MWRKSLNVTMLSLTGLCALITVSALFFILGYLVWNGGKDLSWNFFTRLPAPVGEIGGGMANAIVGSLKLLAAGGAVRRSDRFARRRVSGGIRRADGPVSGPVHGGPAERRAIDRDRHFCVRPGRHAHASLFDSGRRICAGDHGDPDGDCAIRRVFCATCRVPCARARSRWARTSGR